ncbi:MAG TPA: Rieske 2Fe-2S domain-containing protein [Dehalococcoidia bacterium]|nr:Rieske 2Fe-2S domain-containing protein [Dehalococcoidia bacterium]
MLSKQDNEVLCRVGPGTPMGTLMRQYWIPVFLSSELPAPDCPPVRVRVLGEDLIGFRATSGQPGLVANACPHRGASLFFGRNEEEGLRCVYHGWKFDATGACVDMPSEPAESNFRSKVRVTAYPCRERNGVVWAYMGPRPASDLPPLPDLEPNMVEDQPTVVQKVLRDCNWMQGLEGDIDTSHLGFLHLGMIQPEDTQPGTFDYYTVADRAPRYDVVDTEFGTSYGAYRPAEADSYYWRVAHFLFPFYTMIPTGVLGVQVLVRAWVPIDDEHMMFWSFSVPGTRAQGQGGPPGVDAAAGSGGAIEARARRLQETYAGLADAPPGGTRVSGPAGTFEYLPETSGFLGKWRLAQNASNDYGLDREAQRTRSYTGIPGIHQQDQAITESMGAIYDRTHEHLGTSDAMVIRTRRRLINAAKALAQHGVIPPGVDDPTVYRQRSGGVILPRHVDWQEATRELRKAFVRHRPEEVYAPAIG